MSDDGEDFDMEGGAEEVEGNDGNDGNDEGFEEGGGGGGGEGGDGGDGGEYTEVTHENLGERLSGACMGICLGLLLFFGSFPLLFWNEHRAVDRYDALQEAESQVYSISDPYASIDPANDGKLIHFTANITNGGGALIDPIFGINSTGALVLRREAEMYQWVEKSRKSSQKTMGGGKTTTTTYSYEKQWRSSIVSTSSFKQSGYTNPTTMEFRDYEVVANPISIGSYELPDELKNRINWKIHLPVDPKDITNESIRNRTMWNSGGYVYLGKNYSNPQIGDQRIRWQYTPESVISIVGVQTGKTLKVFVSQSGEGGNVLLLQQGRASAPEMLDRAEEENAAMSWMLRIVGWGVMALGLYLIFRPIEVFADIIPCVGSIIGCGLVFMSVFVSSLLSALTIVIAWLTAHPKIGGIVLVVLLAVIGCCAFGVKMVQKAMGKEEDDDNDDGEIGMKVASDSEPVVHAVPESTNGKVVGDADPEIYIPTVYAVPTN